LLYKLVDNRRRKKIISFKCTLKKEKNTHQQNGKKKSPEAANDSFGASFKPRVVAIKKQRKKKKQIVCKNEHK
jgi:hypothetical protein